MLEARITKKNNNRRDITYIVCGFGIGQRQPKCVAIHRVLSVLRSRDVENEICSTFYRMEKCPYRP